jgi:hypothetical protein
MNDMSGRFASSYIRTYHPFVSRPRPHWNWQKLVVDIFKSSIPNPLFKLRTRLRLDTEGFYRSHNFFRPYLGRAAWNESPIGGMKGHVEVLEFDPAARLGEFEGLSHKAGPVTDGTCKVAGVDIVEGSRKAPSVFNIIDFETNIGGDNVLLSVVH